ncbi:MAG: hypothetical protein ACK4QL_09190 [Pseudanabaenaceae cyanobacterium]
MQKLNTNWLIGSVREFWRSVNWDNQKLQVSGSGIDRRLRVKEFFQSIPWTMMPSSTPVAEPAPGPTPTDTLSDFLNDVSRFF